MTVCENLCEKCPFKKEKSSDADVTVAEALVRVKLGEAELCPTCPFLHNQFAAGGHRKRKKNTVMHY